MNHTLDDSLVPSSSQSRDQSLAIWKFHEAQWREQIRSGLPGTMDALSDFQSFIVPDGGQIKFVLKKPQKGYPRIEIKSNTAAYKLLIRFLKLVETIHPSWDWLDGEHTRKYYYNEIIAFPPQKQT